MRFWRRSFRTSFTHKTGTLSRCVLLDPAGGDQNAGYGKGKDDNQYASNGKDKEPEYGNGKLETAIDQDLSSSSPSRLRLLLPSHFENHFLLLHFRLLFFFSCISIWTG